MKSAPGEFDVTCMAWHEAGHAVCSLALPGRPPVVRLSIEPGDEAFGFMRTEHAERLNETESGLLDLIAVELAGIISERKFLNMVTTSGGGDLKASYQLAFNMVVRFGMGEQVGFVCPGAASADEISAFAARNAAKVEADIAGIIDTARHRAEQALAANSTLVEAVADALRNRKTLTGEDIGKLQQADFNCKIQN